uniref:uncharacterized protein LOC120348411 n=1 Tax=Styela clava TaxID=7725 RepID=UPI00193A573E|nr:uncharacterized protein LOC120348411 [Styela clava]
MKLFFDLIVHKLFCSFGFDIYFHFYFSKITYSAKLLIVTSLQTSESLKMKLFLTACLCYLFVETGYAVMCYDCQDCGDATKLTDDQLLRCPGPVCDKTSENGVVVRTCAGVSPVLGCHNTDTHGATKETCTCVGNKCNGARTVKSSIIVGSVISLLVAKFIV